MAGAGKDKIDVIKVEVPKFIREFKERTGQRIEQVDINSKRPNKEIEDDDDQELAKSDEAPIICLGNDVTEEEGMEFAKNTYGEDVMKGNKVLKRKHEDERLEGNSKFLFKKPTKEVGKKIKKNTNTQNGPKVKNKTLLSFDDEEENEDE